MPQSNNAVSLYWQTARHLKPIQIWRHVRHPQPHLTEVKVQPRARDGEWTVAIKRPDRWLGGKRWRHLNQEHELKTWNDSEPEKLWLYHLHYFEQCHPETVTSWIDENSPGQGIGWNPYPLSRRIANWVAWLLSEPLETEFRRRVEDSLAVQAQWLSQTLEWRLLGNHLLANAKALLMAGTYFEGPAADRWQRQGRNILHRELAEQILEDGGHFELSPMYHSLILEDLLDLLNFAQVYPRVLGVEQVHWREVAGKMLGWLRQLTHPDGQIAYFNDSVHGFASDPSELQQYATRLRLEETPVSLGASGYVRLNAGGTTVLFDAGSVGPDYQPGHGHCDLLSLEVSHRGVRAITNSGVSTYERCARRLEERSTAAHNTLRIDGAEQSEVWSSFRVARRARPISQRTDRRSWAEAAHDGYRRLKGDVTHRRRVEVHDGRVTVIDRLSGSGFHHAELFWHLSPDAQVEIRFDTAVEPRVDEGSWCCGFGLRVPRPTVVGLWQGCLPVKLVTYIRLR